MVNQIEGLYIIDHSEPELPIKGMYAPLRDYPVSSIEYFLTKFAKEGLNCKEISQKMGYHPHHFGKKIKQILGVYPSLYISGVRKRMRAYLIKGLK